MNENTSIDTTTSATENDTILTTLDEAFIFQNEDQVSEILVQLKNIFPKKENAYVPSGKTSFFAFLVLCFGFLLTIIVGSMLDVGLAYIDSWIMSILIDWLGLDGVDKLFASELGYVFVMISIAISAIIAIINCVLPSLMSSQLGYLAKNRNTTLAGFFAFASSMILSCLFFLPWVDGETIAPTNFTFLFIPIRWLFIIVGVLILPIITTVTNIQLVQEQRFCEKAQLYLKESVLIVLPLAMTSSLIQIVTNQEWSNIATMKREEPLSDKSNQVSLILFSADNAQTAFLDIKIKAVGIYIKDAEKGSSSDNIETKEDTWLVHSVQIDADTALTIKNLLV